MFTIAKLHILAIMYQLDLFITYFRQGHLDAVVTLMRHGADPGLQDSEGREICHYLKSCS